MGFLVSLCIPAYKQPALLERCLQSVSVQTHKPIEVLISDDTPDESVKIVADRFKDRLNIQYKKNERPLGSPVNWNAALDMAQGDFVMLLHHDDAFASKESLSQFLEPFQKDTTVDFVFARNPSIEKLSNGKPFAAGFFNKYYGNPEMLLTGNLIGAPSNMLLKASAVAPFHPKLKWIVDIEFYARLFRSKKKLAYVDRTLIDIGIHAGQVTSQVAKDVNVLLYENILYAAENNLKIHRVAVYDFYWRLLRNAGVRDVTSLKKTGLAETEIPAFIKNMIALQRKMPARFLQVGAISKLAMAVGYLLDRNG